MQDLTQNYSERVPISSNGDITRPRLAILPTYFEYGYYIMDKKVRYNLHNGPKILWRGGSLERAKQVEQMLINGKKIPKNEPEVRTGRIIVFKEKHGNSSYYVPTIEDLEKVALEILKERNKNGWFYEPVPPSNDIIALSKRKEMDFVNLNLSEHTIKEISKEIETAKRNIKYYNEDIVLYNKTQKALKTENSRLALSIIEERHDLNYEYETYEIIDPIIL